MTEIAKEGMKEVTDEGIINIKNFPNNKDPYHILVENKDILRLEVCKLQNTKEDVSDCLTFQQKNLEKNILQFDHLTSLEFCSLSLFMILSFIIIWRITR